MSLSWLMADGRTAHAATIAELAADADARVAQAWDRALAAATSRRTAVRQRAYRRIVTAERRRERIARLSERAR